MWHVHPPHHQLLFNQKDHQQKKLFLWTYNFLARSSVASNGPFFITSVRSLQGFVRVRVKTIHYQDSVPSSDSLEVVLQCQFIEARKSISTKSQEHFLFRFSYLSLSFKFGAVENYLSQYQPATRLLVFHTVHRRVCYFNLLAILWSDSRVALEQDHSWFKGITLKGSSIHRLFWSSSPLQWHGYNYMYHSLKPIFDFMSGTTINQGCLTSCTFHFSSIKAGHFVF